MTVMQTTDKREKLAITCEFRNGQQLHIQLEASEDGLTECRLLGDTPEAAEESSWQDADDAARAHLRRAREQLLEYFAGTRTVFDVPLAPEGTPFQSDVWKACSQIPYGQTRSYWWIAVRIGNPHAMRAVGGALGANPLPLFIPCHRVVRQDGKLGGFTCGIEWKKALLALEGVGNEIAPVSEPRPEGRGSDQRVVCGTLDS